MRKKGILLTVALLVALLYGGNAQAWTPTEVLKNSAQNLEIAKVVLGMAEGGGIETLLSEANDACAAAQSTQDAGQRFFAGKVAFFNAAFAMKLALANPELRNAYQKEIGDSLWDSANILGFSQDDTITASKRLDPIFSQAADRMYDTVKESSPERTDNSLGAFANLQITMVRGGRSMPYPFQLNVRQYIDWCSRQGWKPQWENIQSNLGVLNLYLEDKVARQTVLVRLAFQKGEKATMLTRVFFNDRELFYPESVNEIFPTLQAAESELSEKR